MPLSIEEIRKLCQADPPLISDLTEEQYREGHSGVDLRLGRLYRVDGSVLLGAGMKRETNAAQTKAVLDWQVDGMGREYVIVPGEYLLAETIEKVNLPEDLVGFLWPRGTLHHYGLMINTSPLQPGYSGGLIFGLHNAGSVRFTIEAGARLVNSVFFRVEGEANPYVAGDKVGRVLKGVKEA